MRSPRSLKGYFSRYLWNHVVLRKWTLITLAASWVSLALALESLSYQPMGLFRDRASLVLGVLQGFALVFVLAALLKQLLQVIDGQRGANLKDLGSIGYAYAFVIFAFATMYLAADNFRDASFSYGIGFHAADFRLVDNLYFSGITIATVGYGDITPRTWPVKTLAVLEPLTGLWLTVTVLGVFIGSLLNRQVQDKQSKFFRDFLRDYFAALTNCQKTINDIAYLQPEQIEEFRREIMRTVARFVRLHYEPMPSATVRANWMRFYSSEKASEEALQLARRFVLPEFDSPRKIRNLRGVLLLQEWDVKPETMPGKDELALPVYHPQTHVQLPGAPQALDAKEGYVIVSNVDKMDLSKQPKDVKRRLTEYFRDRAEDIKSFASVRIASKDNPYGIINIQSDDVDLCGTSAEDQQLLVDMIRPFATYLLEVGLRPEDNK